MGDKIKLQPPEGTTSASVDGVAYGIGDDGLFEVDPAHAQQLYGFGFGNPPAAPATAAKKKAAAGDAA